MKQINPLEDLVFLSNFVYRLNSGDENPEDHVYRQIINYLADNGSFTLQQLDKKLKIKNKKGKIKRIERRKLKKILEGTDKDFTGLIPLNYVTQIPEWKNRGGNREHTYYPTEKGIMASISYKYKKNINLKKILKHYKLLSNRYKKFVSEFIKLQIQVYLSYYYVQGISLAFKKENNADFDEFRQKIINPFEIKIADNKLEQQFKNLLDKLNAYRKVHLKLSEEKPFLDLLWEESTYVRDGRPIEHGFHGWYQIQFLTGLDDHLNHIRRMKKIRITANERPNGGITVSLVSEPVFLCSLFQENANNISDEIVKNTMISLGLQRGKVIKPTF